MHTPVGGGHKAAALAVAEAARAKGLSVEVLDTFEHGPRVFGGAYLAAHLTAQGALPELYGTAYFGSNRRDGAFEPLRRGFDHVAWAGLVRAVIDLHPGAVIATHHLPLVVLGRARRYERLLAPLVGVVTDYGAHAVWAERGVDALCVPGARAFGDVVLHGFPSDRVRPTGIPVRSAFERIGDVRAPAPGEPLRVLVTSGGFGIGPIRSVVASFAGMGGVELTVVCGRADGLVREVEAVATRCGVRAEVIGFERDMPARVAAAHIVVGKAGGLTVSEALTAGRPMVLAGAVPGNETINAELVVNGAAGLVARPGEVGAVVGHLHATAAIESMGRNGRRLVFDRAAERVIEAAQLAMRGQRPADRGSRRAVA